MKVGAAIAAALTLSANPTFANEKTVKCEITSQPSNEVQFAGKCKFEAEQGGSFSLSDANGGDLLYESISVVHVYVTAKGHAEVSGLVLDEGGGGHNSRWGAAKRSQKDGACWEGEDFRICAW